MKDGLYEIKDHDSFFNVVTGYFVCRNNETTAIMPTKKEALSKILEGEPIQRQISKGKWIAPLYPANGVWKNNITYFAHRDGKITAGYPSEAQVISDANKGLFSNSACEKPSVGIEYISPIPTSRVKLLTGEHILTMNPPKKDFDIYVRNFGYYNEVSVEEVVRFARENHPCWEGWLKERGIPFEDEISIGDIVEVVKEREVLRLYDSLAEQLGARRFCYDSKLCFYEKVGRVIAIGSTGHGTNAALVDVLDEEILVELKGLRKIG